MLDNIYNKIMKIFLKNNKIMASFVTPWLPTQDETFMTTSKNMTMGMF